MYPNLRAEMARRGVTISQLAAVIGVQLQTLSRKLNGGSEFTLTEAYAIKDYLGLTMPIEVLFKRAAA